MSEQTSSVRFFCPCSQSEGLVVTETGDIQMQTFSVTSKVQTSVLCPSRVSPGQVLTLSCCPSCRETAPTTWRPRWSSQVHTWTSAVLPVCCSQALKVLPSSRCPGLPAETSGGFCQADGLGGDGVGPGDSRPRPVRLYPGGPQPERYQLQPKRPCDGGPDGRLGEREAPVCVAPPDHVRGVCV